MITRQLSGQSALVGGRDHLSHRLVALGVGDRRAVLVLCGLATAGGLAALGVQNLPAWLGWTAMIAYGITVVAIGIVLGRVSVEHEDRHTDRRPLR